MPGFPDPGLAQPTSQLAHPTSQLPAQPVALVHQYGEVRVFSDGTIMTPVGTAHVKDTHASVGPHYPIVRSTSHWSTGMVIVSVITALFTLGLGLLLLFLSRSERTYTIPVESVVLDAPGFQYIAQGPGSVQMVGWLTTWRRQLVNYAQ